MLEEILYILRGITIYVKGYRITTLSVRSYAYYFIDVGLRLTSEEGSVGYTILRISLILIDVILLILVKRGIRSRKILRLYIYIRDIFYGVLRIIRDYKATSEESRP